MEDVRADARHVHRRLLRGAPRACVRVCGVCVCVVCACVLCVCVVCVCVLCVRVVSACACVRDLLRDLYV